jgi:hypothetical protein
MNTPIFIKEFILKHLNILCCTECDYLQKFLKAILLEESVSYRVSEGETGASFFHALLSMPPVSKFSVLLF